MPAKTQEAPIDIASWPADDLFGNYPEGARSKNAIFPPNNLNLHIIVKNRRYLYKRSNRKYPDQFWSEVVAYQTGCLLGVTVPPAFAAYNSIDGDCGALIEWFYEDGKAAFTPGGAYMQRLMPEFDRKRGELHNYQAVKKVGRAFAQSGLTQELWEEKWADAFLFDALIGNTDRHQDNWGYLAIKHQGKLRLSFAPLFDNGTSLGHERFEEHIASWTKANFERYVNKGTHHIRWQYGDPEGCGHFALIEKMTTDVPQVRGYMLRKIEQFDVVALEGILDYLRTLQLPIAMTPFRKKLYIDLIVMRKEKILAALA